MVIIITVIIQGGKEKVPSQGIMVRKSDRQLRRHSSGSSAANAGS